MQMAWIKANFPLAFYAAMITYDSSKFALYKTECLNKDINIYGPHINKSNKDTTIDIKNHALRVGLNQIKGLGDAAVNTIINNRITDYVSINDFFSRGIGRAVNKKIIETLINNDCFEGIPIIFDDNTISEDSPLFAKKPLYLSRGELLTWYDLYYNMKNEKLEKNYVLIKENLPRNLQEDKTLIFEKDGTIIVPASKLNEFGIKGSNTDGSFTDDELNNLISTRKKPKGRLLKYKNINKVNPLLKPFLQYEPKILANIKTNTEMYIYDILNNDGVSFRCHPLTCIQEHISNLSLINQERDVHILGIILSIHLSKAGRAYSCNIITPYEIINILIWAKEYELNKKNYAPGNFIQVIGTYNPVKGYIQKIHLNQDIKRGHSNYQILETLQIHSQAFDNISSYISYMNNKYTDNNKFSLNEIEQNWLNTYLKLQQIRKNSNANIKPIYNELQQYYKNILRNYKYQNGNTCAGFENEK